MKASFYTLGCKVNQYESQAMSELLQKAGFEIVNYQQEADIYIINSCTVTSVSDQKTRQSVRRFKRSHPNAIVVLTGCMPQAYPQAAMELKEADIVLSNRNNDDILTLINEFCLTHRQVVRLIKHEKEEPFTKAKISSFSERTRAFVKIEDGCDRFCSYCIIPTARGRVRSKTLEDIQSEAAALAANGIKEIVLVGINLSAYGKGSQHNICDAVHTVCGIDGIQRVRLGSLEPDHLTPAILNQLSKEEKLCPQFHISLQSGCDKTLKEMNRHYSVSEYRQLCHNLRQNFKDCTLTTDMMVGFPGESEGDFAESLRFAAEIGFEKIHVFPYSARENTPAAKRPQIDKAIKEERCHRLLETAEQLRGRFLQQQIGKTVNVLFESRHADNFYEGYTTNYTPVRVQSNRCLSSHTLPVKIISSDTDACYGCLLEKEPELF